MSVPLRRVVRAATLVSPALLLLLVAPPATAAPPVSWPDGGQMSTLEYLLLIVGAPLALFVVITLLVMAPSVAKGKSYRSNVSWYSEIIEFGTRPSGEARTDSTETTGGGSSVRW